MIFNMVGGGSSSAALNFTVVGGTTKPSNPTENTIWVNTSTAITSWVFDAPPAPTGSAGMVWFEISTSSTVYFNTIKSNNITVYPVSCKQYISNSWVEKSIQVYQSGSWKSLWTGELYKSGNEYEGITGGWTYTKLTGFNKDNPIADSINHDPTITRNSANMSMKPSGSISSFSVHTTKKIDLTKYNTLTFTGSCVNPAYDVDSACRMSIKTLIASGYYSTDNVVSYKVVSNTSAIVDKTGTITLDVSAISGEHYISFDFWTHNFELKMESLILS